VKSKLLSGSSEKTFAVVLDPGDEAMAALLSFAKKNNIAAAHFTAIGGFSRAVLGFFDIEKKDYLRIAVDNQVEVVSLNGDIALEKAEPRIHAHVVVGKRTGAAMAGNLIEGFVRPTLEIVLTESPTFLRREFDFKSGLALINL